MTIERWTDDRLDKLADGVEQLIGQLGQLGDQISQLGDRIEQTCERVDAFVEGKHDRNQSAPSFATQASNQSVHLLGRLTTLESQMHQLMQRVQYLERREVVHLAAQAQPVTEVDESEEDGIEDEPDEILWDFFDPSEQQK